MWSKLAFLALAAAGSYAAPSSIMTSRQNQKAPSSAKLLLGGGPPGSISVAEFDGTAFKIATTNTIEGSAPSWLLPKGPDLLYAVDENSNTTRTFKFDREANTLEVKHNATGSSGVVSLAFNKDQTRLVGAAYGQGTVDVWDSSAADGSLKLLKTITPPGPNGPNKDRQSAPHPHQVLLDPSGRYFFVNDLGTDKVFVLDSQDDKFNIASLVEAEPAGAGPRHGAFYPPGADKATHYFLACEMANVVLVFSLAYDEAAGGVAFVQTHDYSTFGDGKNHTGAAAGELAVSADGEHLYVSNRLTGGATDSIAHFYIDTCGGDVELQYAGTVSTGGKLPRVFGLSSDGGVVFAANQDGETALAALEVGADGELREEPVASLPLTAFGKASQGPMFVQQI